MTERGVDDRGVRHGEHELLDADARQQLLLGEQAIVGGRVELEDRLQVRVVVRDRDEHAVAAAASAATGRGDACRTAGRA